MLYKLHFFFMAAGANALGILLGVYIAEYTDATPGEIGLLYMLMPFVGMAFRPIICSLADRHQAHRSCMILCELVTAISFLPFVVIPYLGPDFYEARPRLCWYILVSFKIFGDIAFGGGISVGDSLAINYAKRIGTEYSTYRIWATISWMIFGFVTGQLNEIWFLPKFVAAFIVLIVVSLLDALVCFLWPRDYFVMITASMMRKEREQQLQQLEQQPASKTNWSSTQTRSLMPKEVVWAHAKRQLVTLVTFGACSNSEADSSQTSLPAVGTNADTTTSHTNQNDGSIGKEAQLQTLFLLVRRDPRIVLYLIMFIGAGAMLMPMSFFFMSLSEICHSEHTCDFSKLGGYLQISMASVESLLFMRIKTIVDVFGRLNTLTIAFALAFCKFLFYATIWTDVNPYWSIISEMGSGLIYATFLTVQVEMAHLFATEVEHLIPELVARGLIDTDNESSRERLKLSLSATMQALMASANDGLGRGLGALAYGLILDSHSYEFLWAIIATIALLAIISLQLASLFERCCRLRLGLDKSTDLNQSKLVDVDVELQGEGKSSAAGDTEEQSGKTNIA